MAENETEDQRQTEPSGTQSQRPRARIWKSILALALAVTISAAVIVIGRRIDPAQFQRYGYPGVFIINLLGNATIIMPVPSLAVVSAVGPFLNPYLVGVVAGLGSALGELTGYLAGYSGRAAVDNQKIYAKIVGWTNKYGLWVIFVLSIIPNPLFDLAGIAAGALKVSLWQFLLVCWAGKTIKMIVFALGGDAFVRLFWP
ncbi:MAG: VTT domain-containing protein [Anaerolineae bacterium]|nr:VTT domain-containing protein [Anaerolineae bacterium]